MIIKKGDVNKKKGIWAGKFFSYFSLDCLSARLEEAC